MEEIKTACIDFGNQTSVLSIPTDKGYEIVLNESSNRKTPTMVSYQEFQRFSGEFAQQQQMMSVSNTITQLKRLIGLHFNSEEQKRLSEDVPFKIVCIDESLCGIQLENGEILRIEQIIGFYLKSLFNIIQEKNQQIKQIVLTVPSCWTELQRRSIINAAKISNVNIVELMDSSLASAISYVKIHCDRFPDEREKALNVLFIEIGDTSMNTSLAKLSKKSVEIISNLCDESFGGHILSETLEKYMLKKVSEKYKINPLENKRSLIRFKQECEKLKKTLSANKIVLFEISSLNDVDVSFTVKVEEFNELIKSYKSKLKTNIEKVIKDSGIKKEELSFVEIVGGSSRIPLFKEAINEIIGQELKMSLNLDECIAIGAAYMASKIDGHDIGIDFIKNHLSYHIEIKTDKETILNNSFEIPVITEIMVPVNKIQKLNVLCNNCDIGTIEIQTGSEHEENILIKIEVDKFGLINIDTTDKQKCQSIVYKPLKSLSQKEIDEFNKIEEKSSLQDKTAIEVDKAKNKLQSLIFETQSQMKSIEKDQQLIEKVELIYKWFEENEFEHLDLQEYILKIDELNPLYEKVNQQLNAQNNESDNYFDISSIKLDIFNRKEEDNCIDNNDGIDVYDELIDYTMNVPKQYLSYSKYSKNSDETSIFIADLPVNDNKAAIDEEFLRQLFEEYNVLNEPDAITIKTKRRKSGSVYCYAFVKFKSRYDAVRAINDLNYTKFDNVPIRLMLADKETKRRAMSNYGWIIVENIDPYIDLSQLHDVFSNFGDIIQCKIPTDVVIKEGVKRYIPRGYVYIQFRNEYDALQAIRDLKHASLNGRPIEIRECKPYKFNSEKEFNICYIKNLPENYDDCQLRKLVSQYGNPLECTVYLDENKKSRRFGFITMPSHKEAVRIIDKLNGLNISRCVLYCSRAKSAYERHAEISIRTNEWRKANYLKYKGRNLYVKNFDESITDDKLREIFSQLGEIENAIVMKDEFGKSKKFGFVCYKTRKQAEECIRKSAFILINGKQPYVSMALPYKERQKQKFFESYQVDVEMPKQKEEPEQQQQQQEKEKEKPKQKEVDYEYDYDYSDEEDSDKEDSVEETTDNTTNPEETSIFVADLPVNDNKAAIDEEFLRQLFEEYNVSNEPDAITIKTKVRKSGSIYCYAFVKLNSREDAVRAINDLNYTKIEHVPIRLMLADDVSKENVENDSFNLFIKNLDKDIEVSQLHDAFANFGEIIQCKIAADVVIKEGVKRYISRGYGYVQFRNPEDAQKAQNDLNDTSINGQKIEVSPFDKQKYQKSNEIQFNEELPVKKSKKDILKQDISENHPKRTFLLRRIKDMSNEQIKMLYNDKKLFKEWMNQ